MKGIMMGKLCSCFIAIIIFSALVILSASADETLHSVEKMAYPKTTSEGVAISVDELELLLKPLTRQELEGEAQGWFILLQNKVKMLSLTEIKSKRNYNDNKEMLVKKTADLKTEKAALIDRFNAVIDELGKKGGTVDEYKQYIDAVSGIGQLIEVDDANATWTRLVGWVKSQEGGVKYGKKFGLFILTIISFWILAIVLSKIARKGIRSLKKASELLKDFIVNFVRKATFVVGLLVALSMLGVETGPILATIGVMGFVVGFALQGPLSNFASGIMILLYRPYDIGDILTLDNIKGTVNAMTMVSTTIQTPDNKNVIFPNSRIWEGVITNMTGNTTRRVDMTFSLNYADDAEKARSIIEDVVKRHQRVLKDPEPVVKIHELTDFSVKVACRPWANTEDYWVVRWDINQAVKDRFSKEGIRAPLTHNNVQLYKEDREETTVPV